MNKNPLLRTDVYKMGHMEQYAPGCSKVYSYLQARTDRWFHSVMFFGLQYYLQEYLARPLTPDMGEEFLHVRKQILGSNSREVEDKIRRLCRLGYWPLLIKSIPEGSVLPVHNVMMTITNTIPEYYWVVGFVESLLLKLWYPCTVATQSYRYRLAIESAFGATVDDSMHGLLPFMVHDFGYRSDSSEEGAALSGVAHLANFVGSDTVPAFQFACEYYDGTHADPLMLSVPASEHSVMCSFGRHDEIGAFRHILQTYPEGIVSIVSDTFDVYRVLTEFAAELKPQILARPGKVVFRPDSGNPEYIICGDPTAPPGSNEYKGAIRLLDEMFGSTVNAKGFKVLNEKVGLIYGDGMYLERYQRTLSNLQNLGYAASNLVVGVGGILRHHSRDTLGFAIKATYVEVNGEPREIEKDPITDHGKKSHKGLLQLTEAWTTLSCATPEQEATGLLKPVFQDGQLLHRTTLNQIRQRVTASLNRKK